MVKVRLFADTANEARDVQPLNAPSPIVSTEPISTETREVQPSNAETPMAFTESGKAMEVREVHPLNAESAMKATELPMLTEVIDVQQLRTEDPTAVTSSEIITFRRLASVICQGVLFGDPYENHFPEPWVKVIVLIFTQPEKLGFSSEPTQSRLAGTVSSFNSVQSANADAPREVAESGTVTDTREAPRNAWGETDRTVSGMT